MATLREKLLDHLEAAEVARDLTSDLAVNAHQRMLARQIRELLDHLEAAYIALATAGESRGGGAAPPASEDQAPEEESAG